MSAEIYKRTMLKVGWRIRAGAYVFPLIEQCPGYKLEGTLMNRWHVLRDVDLPPDEFVMESESFPIPGDILPPLELRGWVF